MQRKSLLLVPLVLLCFFLISEKTTHAATLVDNNVSGGTFTGSISRVYTQYIAVKTGAINGVYINFASAVTSGGFLDFEISDTASGLASTSCGYAPDGTNGVYFISCGNPTAIINAGDLVGVSVQGHLFPPNTPYVSDAGGIFPFFDVVDTGGSDLTYGATHIIDMQPATGSTTATNLVNFSLSAYINPSDAARGVGVKVYLHNIDQNVLLAGALSPSDIVLYNQYVTTGGTFNFSTSTLIGSGNYRLYAKLSGTAGDFFGSPTIAGCSLIGGFLTLACTDASTQFIVVAPTFIGNISQQSYAQMNTLFSSTSATSTANLSTSCNPLSGFNVVNCLAFLFIPDAGLVSDSLANFRDNAATHFPLGYVTDFLNILSTTTTGTLTILDVVVPPGIPGTGAHLQLALAHQLDPLLNATTSQFNNVSASSTGTFEDITMYYWNLVVYVGTGLYLVGRVLGSHLISL